MGKPAATCSCAFRPCDHTGRENALVWQPGFRQQGGAAAGRETRVDTSRRDGGKVHHCMVAGALVPGSAGGHRNGADQPEPLLLGSVAVDAHRRGNRFRPA